MKLSLPFRRKFSMVFPSLAAAVMAHCMDKGKVAYFTVCYWGDQYMKYFM